MNDSTPVNQSSQSSTSASNEQEHIGSIWSHPYMIYIVLTIVLFAILVGIGYLAIDQGWVPTRGTV